MKTKFIHNQEANEKIIKAVLEVQNKEGVEKLNLILSHLLIAHQIWNDRIQSSYAITETILHPWDYLNPQNFASTNLENHKKTDEFLKSTIFKGDSSYEITYQNSKGDVFNNKVSDVYYHILSHSAYHRGQIALLLRNMDIDPPVTDYIFFMR